MTTNVTILLGGLFGWDGYVTSRGMLDLSTQLKAISPYLTTSIYTWDQWETAAIALNDDPDPLSVVIGYSGGGSRATWLANFDVPRIDLMILYDPSPAWQMKPIGTNVKSATCFQNSNPAFFGLGGGILKGTATISTIKISENHLLVQSDQHLHDRTIALVKHLMGM